MAIAARNSDHFLADPAATRGRRRRWRSAPSATAREPERLHAGAATYSGLFCVTLSTLMLEIVLTRIFSVTMWYHFAFVAISVALFGMTVGALIVHLLPAPVPRRARQAAPSGSPPCCSACRYRSASSSSSRSRSRRDLTVGGIASVIGTCAVISVPFVFSGIVVCLA